MNAAVLPHSSLDVSVTSEISFRRECTCAGASRAICERAVVLLGHCTSAAALKRGLALRTAVRWTTAPHCSYTTLQAQPCVG